LAIPDFKQLLASFATDALGLELRWSIRGVNKRADRPADTDAAVVGPTACLAWNTNHGIVTFRAIYDEVQSLRIGAHVMKIAWSIGDVHHDSWWHCRPKFPRDWIKGVGWGDD
jgi:hypothetical protein